jgi:hypothetical protein
METWLNWSWTAAIVTLVTGIHYRSIIKTNTVNVVCFTESRISWEKKSIHLLDTAKEFDTLKRSKNNNKVELNWIELNWIPLN